MPGWRRASFSRAACNWARSISVRATTTSRRRAVGTVASHHGRGARLSAGNRARPHRATIGELLGGLLPGAGAPAVTVKTSDGAWEYLAEGVEHKSLWREGDMLSRFIRLRAGACLPARDQQGSDEECMMLEGDAYFDDLLVCAGDFHLIPAGARHAPVLSDNGALFFLKGPTDRSRT